MLLAVPAPTVASVCTYWALKLIASAVPALAPVTLFQDRQVAGLIDLNAGAVGHCRTGVIAVGQLHADAAGAVAGTAQGGIALHADAEKADAHVGRRRTEDRNRKALRLAAGSPFAMKLPRLTVPRLTWIVDVATAAAAAANVHIQGGDIDADRRAGDKAGACAGLLFNGHLPTCGSGGELVCVPSASCTVPVL